jgi:OFA family oxalate/formate antiporter-like MFS transporter
MLDRFFQRSWLFMFLNISCGLCLIPLAKQMMSSATVGYPAALATTVVALCGLCNGGGRFVFALWSDRMPRRIQILDRILAISALVMAFSLWPPMIGIALLAINACYGAGFSVIPAILSDHFGMANISKIHGAVLSAWGVAGLVGNQVALLVSDTLGLGYYGVVAMLVVLYLANLANVRAMRRP